MRGCLLVLVAATNMAASGSYHRDPLAAVTLTRPGLVRTASRRLDVTRDGRRLRARAVTTLLGRAQYAIPAHRVQGTSSALPACATAEPPRAWVVTSLPVFAAGR